MKIILRPRASGKTSELIKMADAKNGYIVCHDLREAERVFRVAKEQGYSINMPITYDEFLRGEYHGRGCNVVYIDNAQMLLQRLAACKIEAVTFSEE